MPNVVPSARMAKRGSAIGTAGSFGQPQARASGKSSTRRYFKRRVYPVTASSEYRSSPECMRRRSGAAPSDDACTPTDESNQMPPHLHAAGGLSFHATRSAQGRRKHRPSSAIVVGGGMVGGAIALELTRRGVQVTVVDERPPPGPTYSSLKGDVHCVDATTGSWAWLNANGKGRSSPSAVRSIGSACTCGYRLLLTTNLQCGVAPSSLRPILSATARGTVRMRCALPCRKKRCDLWSQPSAYQRALRAVAARRRFTSITIWMREERARCALCPQYVQLRRRRARVSVERSRGAVALRGRRRRARL